MTPARNAIAFSTYALASAAYQDLGYTGNRVFTRMAPDGAGLPYAVLNLFESPDFVQAKDKGFSEVMVEVQNYAATGAQVDAIADAVIEQFRVTRLSPVGFKVTMQSFENRFSVNLVVANRPTIVGEVVRYRVRLQPD